MRIVALPQINYQRDTDNGGIELFHKVDAEAAAAAAAPMFPTPT